MTSNESTTPTKQFDYQGSIEITEQTKFIGSNRFYLDQCPDFAFQISASHYGKNKLAILVAKSYTKSAIAVIELTVDNMEPVKKYVDDWKNNVLFRDILIPIHCDSCPKCDNNAYSYCKISNKDHKYLIPITCSITWYGFSDDLLSARLNKNMETYFKNTELSDVKIVVKNDVEFSAHKIVLASNSPVFKKMLTTDMKESRESCINLPELDSDIAEEFLYFLYHGKLDKAGNDYVMLSKLVEVADMYCVSDLKSVCDVSLSNNNNVSSDNFTSLLQLSKDFNLPYLQRRVLFFINTNMKSLLRL